MESDNKRLGQGKAAGSQWKLNIFCAVVIILAATVFFLMGDSGSSDALSWDEHALTLTLSDTMVYTIPYADITHVKLLENVDLGTCLSGSDTSKSHYGIWENEVAGKYILYAQQSVSPIIQISTEGEYYWVALENKETTTAFFNAFIDMLRNAGYNIQ